ncbi:testis-expressed protein 47-like [Actinia tenebrosa]|uniref:Testis-expressed protein 47-like n=1 Tax=Actinia tenebrosa TaxID=6105 RepID=A0A6P8JCC5_ACTTE|nr:testis-expressed protein 47-like [Actinia tenebrosa]
MAATPGGEESVYETGRLSLLDLIFEKNRAQNKKQLVHRLVYISKIRQDVADRREVGAHYEKLFKNSQAQIHGEAVSGLLLIYPVHIVHVLESSANVLQEVINDLAEEEEQSIGGMMHNSRILVYSGDLQNRLFTQWSFRCINQSAARMQEYTTNESIDVAVMEALNLLLKLGEYLGKLPKLSFSKTMDQLPEKVPELLVRQDLLEYLINSKELSSPSEYLKRYTKPLNVVLESELVWPMQTKLFPVLN